VHDLAAAGRMSPATICPRPTGRLNVSWRPSLIKSAGRRWPRGPSGILALTAFQKLVDFEKLASQFGDYWQRANRATSAIADEAKRCELPLQRISCFDQFLCGVGFHALALIPGIGRIDPPALQTQSCRRMPVSTTSLCRSK